MEDGEGTVFMRVRPLYPKLSSKIKCIDYFHYCVSAISSGLPVEGGRHIWEGDKGPIWEGLVSGWGQNLELFKIIQKYACTGTIYYGYIFPNCQGQFQLAVKCLFS